ncbi:MAG: peptide deformylase [Legionellaceae bacterium]|nr:peptide deformylase [Legionellaceae bacterium]
MPRHSVTESMQNIFDLYKAKIITDSYYPETPLDILQARVTAIWLGYNGTPHEKDAAKNFIRKTTSTSHPQEDKFISLLNISEDNFSWNLLEICGIATHAHDVRIEYNLTLVGPDSQIEHMVRQACFRLEGDNWFFTAQWPLPLWQIGASKLHHSGSPFSTPSSSASTSPSESTVEKQGHIKKQMRASKQLDAQISHMQCIMEKTYAAGISATQCAGILHPYQVIIVGVFKDNPTHVAGVERRYPRNNFPAAVIMVDPEIISAQGKQTFQHGCLSVPGPNRCELMSPEKVTVRYSDPHQSLGKVTRTFIGEAAVIVCHELYYALYGKTYIDRAFESLTPEDLNLFKEAVHAELERRKKERVIPELSEHSFHVTVRIDDQGAAYLDRSALTEVLPKMMRSTLQGIMQRIACVRMHTSSAEIPPVFSTTRQSFHASGSSARPLPLSSEDARPVVPFSLV